MTVARERERERERSLIGKQMRKRKGKEVGDQAKKKQTWAVV